MSERGKIPQVLRDMLLLQVLAMYADGYVEESKRDCPRRCSCPMFGGDQCRWCEDGQKECTPGDECQYCAKATNAIVDYEKQREVVYGHTAPERCAADEMMKQDPGYARKLYAELVGRQFKLPVKIGLTLVYASGRAERMAS